MANYPQDLAPDAVCQSHTGHMTGLWDLPTRPLRLNTNEQSHKGHDFRGKKVMEISKIINQHAISISHTVICGLPRSKTFSHIIS